MCEICDRLSLPNRPGPKPRTTPQTPHMQLDQIAPAGMHERLIRVGSEFSGVSLGRSNVSLPDTLAFHLSPSLGRQASSDAFMVEGYEFAHVHAPRDCSLHMCLPMQVLEAVYAKGWGEPHPVAGKFGFPSTIAMIFGPRDESEFKTVAGLLRTSYAFATGQVASV